MDSPVGGERKGLEPVTMTITKAQEASRLHAAWKRALAATKLDDSDEVERAEQEAYDELVDFVETNDLNYSEFDPRGARS